MPVFKVGGAGEEATWAERAKRAEVCGVLSCQGSPRQYCGRCRVWYCEEHSKTHTHFQEDIRPASK
ncbi:MAG: hypothetical protein PHI12_08440 [Dehalococcoidales bacterium]|nr:hypothetical protein [Dehalococcoidales bacterium]